MSISPWIWYGTAAALFGGAAFVTYRLISPLRAAIIARQRGTPQRRCRRCNYDMRATAGLRCPECGTIAKDEATLSRPRIPALRLAACTLAMFTALSLAVLPTVLRVGPLKLLPDWTLLALAGARGMEPGDPFAAELLFRAWDPSNAGRRSAILARLGPALFVVRSTWPADVPLRFIALSPTWAVTIPKGPATQPDFDVDSPVKTIRPHTRQFISHEPSWSDPAQLGPAYLQGTHDVRFAIMEAVKQEFNGQQPDALITRAITFAGTAADYLTAVKGPDLDAAVETYLNAKLIIQPTSGSPALSLVRGQPRPAELRDLALGLKFQIIADNQTIATGECWLPAASSPIAYLVSTLDPVPLKPTDPRNFPPSDSDMSRWTIKVIGSAPMALCDPFATRYWSGTLQHQAVGRSDPAHRSPP